MDSRTERLIELAAHEPCSVRHLYYRAVVDGMPGITKNQSGYLKVQRSARALRRNGRLPCQWIVDNNRTVFHVDTHGGLAEFLQDAAAMYRRDLWRRSPYRVEVWCESDSIAGTLSDFTNRWRMPLFPIGPVLRDVRLQRGRGLGADAVPPTRRALRRRPRPRRAGDRGVAGRRSRSITDHVGAPRWGRLHGTAMEAIP